MTKRASKTWPPRFDHLISTPLARSECSVCRQTIGVAYESGVPCRIDLQLLDPRAEIEALLTGRHRYELIRIANSFQLRYRDRFTTSLDQRKGRPMVMAEHKCPGREK